MLHIAIIVILCTIIGAIASKMKIFGVAPIPLLHSQVRGVMLGCAFGVTLAVSLNINHGTVAVMTAHAERILEADQSKQGIYSSIFENKQEMDAYMAGSQGKSIVYHWSPEYPVCEEFEPLLEAVSRNYNRVINFYKIQADGIEPEYEGGKIKTFPLLVFYEDGKQVSRFRGMLTKLELSKLIDSFISLNTKDLT